MKPVVNKKAAERTAQQAALKKREEDPTLLFINNVSPQAEEKAPVKELPEETQSPKEPAPDFMNIPEKTEIAPHTEAPEKAPAKAMPVPKKRKPGRPSTKQGPQKTIYVQIPEDEYNLAQIALIRYDHNMTNYIRSLIKRDIDENREQYEYLLRLIEG